MILPFLLSTALALYAFFFGISLMQFVAPWERDVSGRTFIEYHRAIDRYMSVWARILAQAQLGITVVILVLESSGWQTPVYWLKVVALGLVVGSVVLAIRGNVPLNQEINRWSPENPPASWTAVRDRWLHYHRLRAWANSGAFVAFVLSVVLGSK